MMISTTGKLSLLGLIAVGSLSVACTATTETEGETTAVTSQAVSYTQDGFKATWTKVGAPFAADKIAACGNTLYALNDDRALYQSYSGGTDAGWSYMETASAARSIGCQSNGSLLALNSDKRLFTRKIGGGWAHIDTPSAASAISSAGSRIYAQNTDRAVYDGNSNLTYNSNGTYSYSWGGWTYRNTPGDAKRITGGDSSLNSGHRAFALNDNGTIWYNDKIRTSTSNSNWHNFNNAGLTLDEITAASSTKLYALTTGRDLYRVDFTETSCMDDKDNDNDGRSDELDYDCYDDWAVEACKPSKTGNYCLSRVSNNGNSMAKCSNGAVVAVYTGDWCTESSTPGQDSVGYIK
jgi:hypothetical protein